MKTTQLGSLASVLLVTACGGDGDAPNLPQSPVEELAASVGGLDALDGLAGLRTAGSGIDRIEDEAPTPEGLLDARTFARTMSIDLASDSIRVDTEATLAFKLLSGAPQNYTEWAIAGASATSNGEHAFGAPGGPRTSDRAASTTRRIELLNPALLIKRLSAGDVTRGEPIVIGGDQHEVFISSVDGIEHEFAVNARSGELAEVRFQESHRLRRDVDVVVSYEGWSTDAIRFPSSVIIEVGGHRISEFTRTELDLNPDLEADLFASESPLGEFSAEDAERGRRSHHFNHAFSSIGLPGDGIETAVTATEIATGLFFIQGSLHNVFVIEQENGLVVVDAPRGPDRARAVIDWVAEQFPGKPITHVVPSHFHQDHSAGVREFVATGARLVVASGIEQHWSAILAAPSTVIADALSESNSPMSMDLVSEADSFVITDSLRPANVIHIPDNVHAHDLVLVSVPSDGAVHVFVADIWAPSIGSLSATGPIEFIRALQVNGLLESDCTARAPLIVVGAHGGVEPIATSIEFMKSNGTDLSSLGCL